MLEHAIWTACVCRQRAHLNTKDAMVEFSLSPPAAKVRACGHRHRRVLGN